MKRGIWFHGGCFDGFCAAWALQKFLHHPDDLKLHPVRYGESPPEYEGLDELIIVDFSYPKDVLLQIHKAVPNLRVLDHHKTAEAELAGLDFCTFDLNKSGAHLAWDYCCEVNQVPQAGRDLPWLVSYTEDRDLWLWKLPNSHEVNANLRSHPLDFQVWNDLSLRAPQDLVEGGRAILRNEAQVVDQHVVHAAEITIQGWKVLWVNATTLTSDIGHQLAKGRPFGVTWFRRQDGEFQLSLRSTDDGIDVAEVAKSFGGGGHERAAGFSLTPLRFISACRTRSLEAEEEPSAP